MNHRANCSCFLLLFLSLFPTPQLRAAEVHEAAKAGDLEAVRSLLDADRGLLEVRDDVGYTALNWAAMRGQWAVVRELVARGADVNAAGNDSCISLHCAANENGAGIIALLLAEGALIEARNAWGNTPLQIAVQRGELANVLAFIEHGADLQTVSNEGWTPLHYATKCGHEEVRRALLAAGADEEAVDQFGRIPSDYSFTKPAAVDMPVSAYREYVGDYALAGGFRLKVWEENGHLMLEDFAHDELYPIAWDCFYSKQHPWTATFYRDAKGRVSKLALAFQRQAVVGGRIADCSEPVARPLLGIRPRPLAAGDLPAEQLADLLLVEKAGPQVLFLEVVQEGSAADRAGLRTGDILLEFNHQKLLQSGDLQRMLLDVQAGQRIPVRVYRQGKALNLSIGISASPGGDTH